MEDALTLVLLGIAACFMPLVFGLEITMLGSNNGAQKSSGLVGGVTLFRVLLAIGITLLFAVGVADVGQELSDSTSSLKSAISQFRQDVTSGERIILDMLLFASGILLIVNAFRHIRGTSKGDESTDADSAETRDSKAIETGVVGMLGIGLFMAVTNVNQWVFMTAGVSQILAMHESATKRLLAFIVFLLVSSLMIALPLSRGPCTSAAGSGHFREGQSLDRWLAEVCGGGSC